MEANGLCSLQKCAEPAVTKLKIQKKQTHNYKIRESRRHNKTNKRQNLLLKMSKKEKIKVKGTIVK